MGQLTIKKQIQYIAGILLFALCVVASISVVSAVRTTRVFNDIQSSVAASENAAIVSRDVYLARMNALKYQIAPSRQIAAAVTEKVDHFTAQGELLAGLPKDIRAQFQKTLETLKKYEAYFAAMHEQQEIQNKQVPSLRAVGIEAQKQVEDIMHSAFQDADTTATYYAGLAQQSLLMARFFSNMFLLENSEDNLSKAQAYLSEAKNTLTTLLKNMEHPQRRSHAEGALQDIEKFLEILGSVSQTTLLANNARVALETLGPEAQEFIISAEDALVNLKHNNSAQGAASLHVTTVVVVVASVLSLLCGVLVAFTIQRRITRNLDKVVSDIKQLANGTTDFEIHNLDAETEIGEIARAMETFRLNAIETERIRAEAQAAEARQYAADVENERKLADAEQKRQEETEAVRKAMLAELQDSVGTVVEAASQGEYCHRIIAHFDEPALESLATSVNRLLDGVETGLNETSRVMSQISNGQLDDQMRGSFNGSFEDLQTNVNGMIAKLVTLIGNMSSSGATLTESSRELQHSADQLAQQTEQNAAAVQETSAAIEEFTASIKAVSDNVVTAKENVALANSNASQGVTIAEDAGASMDKIAQASIEIERVTAVINDIAFQINLLALNAGVEAARAGDAGRGFSVVATEVRQLAQRAGEAAKEIAEVIALSNSAVSEGVENVASAKTSLEKIASNVVKVSEIFSGISTAMSEQAAGVEEISGAMTQIDDNTQKQAAAFEEVSASSHVLASEARDMQSSISIFDIGTRQPPNPAPAHKITKPNTPSRQHQTGHPPNSNANVELLNDWKDF